MNARRLLVTLLFLFTTASYANATTVQLKLINVSPGNSDGHYYVYPYNFSIDGSSSLVALLCDDFNDEIYFGETWMANVYSLGDILAGQGQMTPLGGLVANGDRNSAYKDAAWLYQTLEENLNGPNAVSINHTIWSLFTSTPFGGDADVAGWFASATAATSGLTNVQAANMFQDVVFFTPIAGTQSDNHGRPQEFIGSSSVPEPNSLVLLSAGLVGLLSFHSFHNRRRKLAVSAAF